MYLIKAYRTCVRGARVFSHLKTLLSEDASLASTDPTLLGRRDRFYHLCLFLTCSLSLGCGPSIHRRALSKVNTNSMIVIPVEISLDLKALQEVSALDATLHQHPRWVSKLIHETNDHLKPLKIQLELSRVEQWNTSDGVSGERIERLYSQLRQKYDASKGHQRFGGDLSPSPSSIESRPPLSRPSPRPAPLDPSKAILIGVTSYPPSSYPPLDTLVYSQYGTPVIILRRLGDYLSEEQQSPNRVIQSESRLLTRAIGQLFGGIASCELDWMNASRDVLLGRRSRSAYTTSVTSMTSTPRRTPRSRWRDEAPESPTRDKRIDDLYNPISLKWSQVNQNLIAYTLNQWRQEGLSSISARREHACRTLEMISPSCKAHLNRAKNAIAQCYQSASEWISASTSGRFMAPWWTQERMMAQGASALRKGDMEGAFVVCAPLADRSPRLFAAKCAGLAALNLNDIASAVRYLRAYLASHSQDVESHLALAKALGRGGDDASAVALLTRVLNTPSLRPKMPSLGEALYNLGVAHARLGRIERALSTWKQIPIDATEYEDSQRLIRRLSKK